MKINAENIEYEMRESLIGEYPISVSLSFTELYDVNEYASLLRKKTFSFFELFGKEKIHFGKNNQVLGYTYTSPFYREDNLGNTLSGTKTSINLSSYDFKAGFSGNIFIKGCKAEEIEEEILKISEVIKNEDGGLELIAKSS